MKRNQDLQSNLIKKNKYHPYSKKYPADSIMGTCPICHRFVRRDDGFYFEERMYPKIEKVYIHHSKIDKCLEIYWANEKAEKERVRKEKLGFPANPLDELYKDKN